MWCKVAVRDDGVEVDVTRAGRKASNSKTRTERMLGPRTAMMMPVDKERCRNGGQRQAAWRGQAVWGRRR